MCVIGGGCFGTIGLYHTYIVFQFRYGVNCYTVCCSMISQLNVDSPLLCHPLFVRALSSTIRCPLLIWCRPILFSILLCCCPPMLLSMVILLCSDIFYQLLVWCSPIFGCPCLFCFPTICCCTLSMLLFFDDILCLFFVYRHFVVRCYFVVH